MRKITKDYSVNYKKTGEVIHIPKGFSFDGSSIPKHVQFIFGEPFSSKNFIPGLVHDYLYDKCSDNYYHHSRREADSIFRNLLIDQGVCTCKACIMWVAVRTCGRSFYKNTHTIIAPTPIISYQNFYPEDSNKCREYHRPPEPVSILRNYLRRPVTPYCNTLTASNPPIYQIDNNTPAPREKIHIIYPTPFKLPKEVFEGPFSPIIY